MSPAIAPGPQLRRCSPAIGDQGGWHLGDAQPRQGRLDHHFAGELHACRSQPETENSLSSKAPQPTVKIAAGTGEKQPPQARQQRIAQVAMEKRHGTPGDAAAKAVAHDQLPPLAKPLDELVEIGEIVGVVGVGHDHEDPARRGDTGGESAAVSPLGDRDNPRPGSRCQFRGAVRAAVIGDHHLAINACPIEELARLANASRHRGRLVQARQDDGQLTACRAHVPPHSRKATTTTCGAAKAGAVQRSRNSARRWRASPSCTSK